MKRVVVTVKRKGESKVQDLELPAGVPVSEWLGELVRVLGWPRVTSSAGGEPGYVLQAYGPRTPDDGVPVPIDSNLDEIGVVDGFWLVGVPQGDEALRETEKVTDGEGKGPVARWIKLLGRAGAEEQDDMQQKRTGEVDQPGWMSRPIDDL